MKSGFYELTTSDNIIYLTASDLPGIDMLASLKDDLSKEFARLNGRPAYLLIDASDINGFTPEGYQEMEKLNCWLAEKNVVAKAVVSLSEVMSSLGSLWIKTEIKNTEYFTNAESAKVWLALQKEQDER